MPAPRIAHRGLRLAAGLTAAAAVLVVSGCADGESSPGESRSPGRDQAVTLVAALGDSITAGSPRWDPDPGVREPLGTAANPESQYEHWARLDLGPRVDFRNCGVSGERTDEIARRLDDCARGADVLIVQGGINDIAQRRPAAEAAADLRAMVRRGRALGLRVAVADVLPWNNGHPNATPAITELNRLITALAREEGVPVMPFHDTLEDPRAPGRMRPEWTDDGDHPSVAGYRRLGRIVELPR
jgi:lysophospholipase L1-like esterase